MAKRESATGAVQPVNENISVILCLKKKMYKEKRLMELFTNTIKIKQKVTKPISSKFSAAVMKILTRDY